jgi:hypothetical protein
MLPEWTDVNRKRFLRFAYLATVGVLGRLVKGICDLMLESPHDEVRLIPDEQKRPSRGSALAMFDATVGSAALAYRFPLPQFEDSRESYRCRLQTFSPTKTFNEAKNRRDEPHRKPGGALAALVEGIITTARRLGLCGLRGAVNTRSCIRVSTTSPSASHKATDEGSSGCPARSRGDLGGTRPGTPSGSRRSGCSRSCSNGTRSRATAVLGSSFKRRP